MQINKSSLLGLIVLIMYSSFASADNECGLIINESVTCNGDGIPATDLPPYSATQGVAYSVGSNETLVLDISSGASPFTILDNGIQLDGGIKMNMPTYDNLDESITLNIANIEMTAINESLVTMNGSNLILNSSADMTVNSNADLLQFLPVIYLSNNGGTNAAGAINMNVSGEIISFGAQESAAGIYGSTLADGDVNIISSANINVLNAPYGSGIVASNTLASGDTMVQSSGAIETVSGNGISVGAGYLGFGNTGFNNITIESSGDMIIGGVEKSAINASIGYDEGGQGDINIEASGTLDITGDNSNGISAAYRDQSNGLIDINSSADINLSGASSAGFNVAGEITAYGLNLVSNGQISTSGDLSYLVKAISPMSMGDTNLIITTNGDMSQTGLDAKGVFAQIDQGNGQITINSNGVITSSQSSQGISASHNGTAGNVDVVINNDLTLAGEDSVAVACSQENVTTGACNLHLNAGKITTTGDASIGVKASALNGAAINITSQMDIENQGFAGRAMELQISSDDTTYDIDIIGGNIVVTNNPLAAVRISSINNIPQGTINVSNALIDASPNYTAILKDNGTIDVTLDSGSEVRGGIELGSGSDTLHVLAGSAVTQVSLFDGGDDHSDADGYIDDLHFSGANNVLDGSILNNWEMLTVDNGAQLSIDGGTLKVGELQPNLGVFVNSSGVFDVGDLIAYDGNISLNTNSMFEITGAGTGVYSVTGSLSLINSNINASDNNAGDHLIIAGNYSGTGGSINLDVELGGNDSLTDLLTINGDAQGLVTLNVTNVDGLGAATGNNPGDGIKVLQIDGASNLLVTLAGGSINTQQYSYSLVKNNNDGSWYLQSQGINVDVSITKSLLTPGPYHPGDELVYEITVSNSGPNVANNVVVEDLMSNMSLKSIDSMNCLPNSFPCVIQNLASGGSENILVTTVISSQGDFDNQASVSTDEIDTDVSNNVDNSGNGGVATLHKVPAMSYLSILVMMLLLLLVAQFNRHLKQAR